MRVLLIEDDPTTAKSIELMLSRANFKVYSTDSGQEGVDLARSYDYDLILLDDHLPDTTGHDVLRELRLNRVETPVLMLAGFHGREQKLRAFRLGSDDYMTKPFDREELIVRSHAIIRRARGHSQANITTGELTLNLDEKTVIRTDPKTKEQSPVHLSGKEYQMFELLSLRKGMTLTKEMFLNHLYGGMDEPDLKIIDVFICKLRKKIAEAADGQKMIETVWGRGYVLREPKTVLLLEAPCKFYKGEPSSEVTGFITARFNEHPFSFDVPEVRISAEISPLKNDGLAGGFHQAGLDAFVSYEKEQWATVPALTPMRRTV